MPIEKLVVAVREADDQQQLVDAVVDVARPTDALVVLASAYEEEEYEQRVEELEFESQPSTDDVARRSRAVRNVGSDLDDAGVDYEVRGVVGEAGDAFVDLADAVDADLLSIQGKGRTPTGKALFGSTAQQMLLNAPCPVTYVGT